MRPAINLDENRRRENRRRRDRCFPLAKLLHLFLFFFFLFTFFILFLSLSAAVVYRTSATVRRIFFCFSFEKYPPRFRFYIRGEILFFFFFFFFFKCHGKRRARTQFAFKLRIKLRGIQLCNATFRKFGRQIIHTESCNLIII